MNNVLLKSLITNKALVRLANVESCVPRIVDTTGYLEKNDPVLLGWNSSALDAEVRYTCHSNQECRTDYPTVSATICLFNDTASEFSLNSNIIIGRQMAGLSVK